MSRFRFVDRERARYPVNLMCRLLMVSRSGFYAWAARGPSVRALTDEVLTQMIREVHAASRATYGAPRVHAELADNGVHVGRKRVARLMRCAGLAGVSRRRTRLGTGTQRGLQVLAPADLVGRQFRAERPDQLWVADVTYVPTVAGWLYLAVVLDVFSRRAVGWSMDSTRKTELVVGAVRMATHRRRGEGRPGVLGVIHHSDQGSEYTSHLLERELKRIGALASTGSVADCYDNAMAESFFATVECELFDRQPGKQFASHAKAKLAIFDYLETFYNTRRRHSALGYQTPVGYEQHYRATHPDGQAA